MFWLRMVVNHLREDLGDVSKMMAKPPTMLTTRELAAIGQAFLDTCKQEAAEASSKWGNTSAELATTSRLIKVVKRAGSTRSRIKKIIPRCGSRKSWANGGEQLVYKGRPKGPQVPDLFLKRLLHQKAQHSSIFKRNGQEVMLLTSSMKETWMRSQKLRDNIAYSTLCKRSRRAKLCTAKARKRTDVCGVCSVWDNHGKPHNLRHLAESRAKLVDSMPSYFAEWDAYEKTHAMFGRKGFSKAESVAYLEEWFAYVAGHDARNLHARTGLVPGKREALCADEESIGELKTDVLAIAAEFSVHFAIRDVQRTTLQSMLEAPRSRTMTIVWDHQDYLCTYVWAYSGASTISERRQ